MAQTFNFEFLICGRIHRLKYQRSKTKSGCQDIAIRKIDWRKLFSSFRSKVVTKFVRCFLNRKKAQTV